MNFYKKVNYFFIENKKLKTKNWKQKIENKKLKTKNWKQKIENKKLKTKNWKQKIENKKLKTKNWKQKIDFNRITKNSIEFKWIFQPTVCTSLKGHRCITSKTTRVDINWTTLEAVSLQSHFNTLAPDGKLQSYLSTTRLMKITVVFEYCEAKETYSRIWVLEG